MRKKRKSLKQWSQSSGRKISCDFCGKEHLVMEGTWVVNGNQHVLCFDSNGGCFDKVRGVREDDTGKRNTSASGTKREVELP